MRDDITTIPGEDALVGTDLLRVAVCDGKYTIIQANGGGLRALRHGEEWQDLTGNGMVLALAQEVDNLREQLNAQAKLTAEAPVPVSAYDALKKAAEQFRMYARDHDEKALVAIWPVMAEKSSQKAEVNRQMARMCEDAADAIFVGAGEAFVGHSDFIRDPGIARVQEFHEAFDCYISATPAMPYLDEVEQHEMRVIGNELLAIGRRLRHQCAIANNNGHPNLGLLLVRIQLHVEETGEVALAFANQDLANALQELCDVAYVNDGTFLTLGLQDLKEAADEELHAANMSKLGGDGKPIIDTAGRVVKGPNTRKPDMAKLLAEVEGGTA
jgi:predicted HAD superfamily Cof-like phosphohydrolase